MTRLTGEELRSLEYDIKRVRYTPPARLMEKMYDELLQWRVAAVAVVANQVSDLMLQTCLEACTHAEHDTYVSILTELQERRAAQRAVSEAPSRPAFVCAPF